MPKRLGCLQNVRGKLLSFTLLRKNIPKKGDYPLLAHDGLQGHPNALRSAINNLLVVSIAPDQRLSGSYEKYLNHFCKDFFARRFWLLFIFESSPTFIFFLVGSGLSGLSPL
jgi:hypothetical protein